jgi:hypothetical protein
MLASLLSLLATYVCRQECWQEPGSGSSAVPLPPGLAEAALCPPGRDKGVGGLDAESLSGIFLRFGLVSCGSCGLARKKHASGCDDEALFIFSLELFLEG